MPRNRDIWSVDLTNYPDLLRLLNGVVYAKQVERSQVLLRALTEWAEIEYPPEKRKRFFAQLEALNETVREPSPSTETSPEKTGLSFQKKDRAAAFR